MSCERKSESNLLPKYDCSRNAAGGFQLETFRIFLWDLNTYGVKPSSVALAHFRLDLWSLSEDCKYNFKNEINPRR